MASETVSINGRNYDKHTGMPLDDSEVDGNKHNHAASFHSRMNRSKTLDRRYVKRKSENAEPAPTKEESKPSETVNQTVVQESIVVNKISKFAPRQKTGRNIDGIGPVVHPMVQRIHAAKATKQPATVKKVHKPSDVIKAEAISDALAIAPPHHRERHKEPKSTHKKLTGRIATLATAGTALLLLGGYFTYLNMPNLSVRVAAARAGINASYPSYQPSGYSISGPVAYDNGKVQMKFASNGSPQSFVLEQERSGWDSSAVLDDYVTPKAGENYSVTSEGGLTIYTWNGNAAWISGGILYTVSGDSNISPDQIRHMAASM